MHAELDIVMTDPSIRLSVCLSVYLSVRLSVCPVPVLCLNEWTYYQTSLTF